MQAWGTASAKERCRGGDSSAKCCEKEVDGANLLKHSTPHRVWQSRPLILAAAASLVERQSQAGGHPRRGGVDQAGSEQGIHA